MISKPLLSNAYNTTKHIIYLTHIGLTLQSSVISFIKYMYAV